MLLRITFADGSRRDITTSPDGWKWSTDAITANDLYDGETYDARLHRPWDQPGFDDARGRPSAHDRRAERQARREPDAAGAGRGHDQAGRAHPAAARRVRVRPRAEHRRLGAAARERARRRHGAHAHRGGARGRRHARHRHQPQREGDRHATRCAGGGPETYEPRFTYHGFRYVEVTGFPGTPTLDSLDGRVAHADVASTGSFESSDPLLNRIWTMNRWGIVNNSMATPTDTPVRDERTPPAMDVQAYADASTREFGMDRFYAKYLEDLPPGAALPTDDVKAQYPDMAGGQVVLPWTLYEQYGDRATLAQHYPAMKAFVDRNATEKPDHIWPDNQGFGDWCPPIHGGAANGGMGGPNAGDCFSEVSIVNTALSYNQADARRQGGAGARPPRRRRALPRRRRRDQGRVQRPLPQRGRQRLRQRPPDDEHPPAGVRHGAARAVQAVGDRLVQNILVDNGGHLDTGIFGTRYIVDALAAIGRIDVAMTVLGQETYPGFGFELAHGATTPWEQWTYCRGHAHPRPRDVRRGQHLAVHAARRHQAREPRLSRGDDRPAGAARPRPRGREHRHGPRHGRVRVERRRDSLRLEVTIPPNATATVRVPLGRRPGRARPRRARSGSAPASSPSARRRWTFVTGKTAVDVPGHGRRHRAADPVADARRAGLLRRVHARRRPDTPPRRRRPSRRPPATRRLSVAGGRLANGAFTLPSAVAGHALEGGLDRADHQRRGDDRLQAAHRRRRPAANGQLQQDADVHARRPPSP